MLKATNFDPKNEAPQRLRRAAAAEHTPNFTGAWSATGLWSGRLRNNEPAAHPVVESVACIARPHVNCWSAYRKAGICDWDRPELCTGDEPHASDRLSVTVCRRPR